MGIRAGLIIESEYDGTRVMAPHSLEQKKVLGAYYTPKELSDCLAEWAIRTSRDTVMEPSFGGCGFLESFVSRYSLLGLGRPYPRLFGADIDPKAFEQLSAKLGSLSDIQGAFVKKDFMDVVGEDFSRPYFDAVVGNPPYISLHNMSVDQRMRCRRAAEASPFLDKPLSKKSSLWAYFLLHSLNFLSDGGRVAWVLPSSLLHADYSRDILDVYKRHFTSLRIIKLHSRLFRSVGAQEVSVVLLADGFHSEGECLCKWSQSVVGDVQDLNKVLREPCSVTGIDNYKHSFFTDKALKKYQRLSESDDVSIFGDLCDVKIGLVTGDNKRFILSGTRAKALKLPDSALVEVIRRFSDLPGLFLNKHRFNKVRELGKPCLLVAPKSIARRGSNVRRYLASFDRVFRRSNKTILKRKQWFNPNDERVPDAFLSYMSHLGLRLVINSYGINCTNSIHRVYFKQKISKKRMKALAASLLSTFTQISTELEGRSYGSGVLKMEPSAAKKMAIVTAPKVLSDLELLLPRLDQMLIEGKMSVASQMVDKVVIKHLGVSHETLASWEQSLKALRKSRYGDFKGEDVE